MNTRLALASIVTMKTLQPTPSRIACGTFPLGFTPIILILHPECSFWGYPTFCWTHHVESGIAPVMKMVNTTQYGQDILGVVPQVGGSESELDIEIGLQLQVTSMFVNVGAEWEEVSTDVVGRLDWAPKRGRYNCSYVVAIAVAAARRLTKVESGARNGRYGNKVDLPSDNQTRGGRGPVYINMHCCDKF